MDRDRKVIGWGVMALVLVMLLIAFFFGLHLINQFGSEKEAEYAQSQRQLGDMEMHYAALKDELRRVGTDSYVENEAREKYGYIQEGEICFEFTNPEVLNNYTREEWQIIVDERLK